MIASRDCGEKIGTIIAPFVKKWGDDGPRFRKNLSAEETEHLFGDLYKLIRETVEE